LRVLVVDGSRAMRRISRRTLHTVEAGCGTVALVAAAPSLHAHSSPTPLAVPASVRVVTRPAPAGPRSVARAGAPTRPVLRAVA
jgi:hypothetical protein